ncbi:MAG: hypothetical protein M1817_003401 [Caeruleum heppii]|nr:MAG: hypothetical protein M1817_003401 [Caeruleum heppii]
MDFNSLSSSGGEDLAAPAPAPAAVEEGKAKRQLLSCIVCRKRKVKVRHPAPCLERHSSGLADRDRLQCDRVYPCQACCASGRPNECKFNVRPGESYEPIPQAYEIRSLREENERLKRRLRAGPQLAPDDDGSEESSPERLNAPRVPSKPTKLRQRRFKTSDPSDNLYFGSPGLANVIADFANMQVSAQPGASVTHVMPRGVDIFAFQDAPLYAFPTLWRADQGAAALLNCLPPHDELFGYLDSFERRAQSCSFPHVPDEITKKEIERFLSDAEGNAFAHPDMLALIFAALAQGLQNGVYDKSGGQWVEGAMEAEAWKGDLYIAAAMQALRVASFMNRPTLLSIQVLVMIGPYLTNGGKFLDAWALFGVTIRLAQSIGLHRKPQYLDPAPPLRECAVRQSLWWWMLHMDQQYSMTLGRPLGISGIGDCDPPEPLTTNPTILRLSEYINTFTILARQILSSDRLTTPKIDEYTDKLLSLRDTLPEVIQFDETWNDSTKAIPPWPLDAQAAVFYGKTHNFLMLLNRQRTEESSPNRPSADVGPMAFASTSTPVSNTATLRGRERVLASARALLYAFEFFHSRVQPAMICWTMGQQAFNASMILTLSLLHPRPTSATAMDAARDDYMLVHRAYATFLEMHQKGIHKLAGVASTKLAALLVQLQPASEESSMLNPFNPAIVEGEDAVMGNTGMMLLEDPGLQGFVGEGFAPLGFQMAGGQLPAQGMGLGTPGWSARAAPAHPGFATHEPGTLPEPQHMFRRPAPPAPAPKPELLRVSSGFRA